MSLSRGEEVALNVTVFIVFTLVGVGAAALLLAAISP